MHTSRSMEFSAVVSRRLDKGSVNTYGLSGHSNLFINGILQGPYDDETRYAQINITAVYIPKFLCTCILRTSPLRTHGRPYFSIHVLQE